MLRARMVRRNRAIQTARGLVGISERWIVSNVGTFGQRMNHAHRILPIPNQHPRRRNLRRNPHRIRIPIIPARRKRQRRAQIAIDIKRHRRALDREIGCHFGESLHDDPDDGGDDDECFFVVLAERCDGGGEFELGGGGETYTGIEALGRRVRGYCLCRRRVRCLYFRLERVIGYVGF